MGLRVAHTCNERHVGAPVSSLPGSRRLRSTGTQYLLGAQVSCNGFARYMRDPCASETHFALLCVSMIVTNHVCLVSLLPHQYWSHAAVNTTTHQPVSLSPTTHTCFTGSCTWSLSTLTSSSTSLILLWYDFLLSCS